MWVFCDRLLATAALLAAREKSRAKAYKTAKAREREILAKAEKAQMDVAEAELAAMQERAAKELRVREAEQLSMRSQLQSEAHYDPKTEEWEEAERRLLKTFAWRVPTQDELNHSSEQLVGETIFVKGFGVGTVTEFVKSVGWGFHSSHVIEFSPLKFGLMGVSHKTVLLKRKKNHDTPWLIRVDTDGVKQASVEHQQALQARGPQLWAHASTVAPILTVQRDARARAKAREAEVLSKVCSQAICRCL